MNDFNPMRVKIIAVLACLSFLVFIARLILKGRLREEYSIIWIISTIVLLIFSIWTNGLVLIARLLGVFDPPNLIFIGAIFAMMIYLLHLSMVVSKLQKQNKILSQEIALLKEKGSGEAKDGQRTA